MRSHYDVMMLHIRKTFLFSICANPGGLFGVFALNIESKNEK